MFHYIVYVLPLSQRLSCVVNSSIVVCCDYAIMLLTLISVFYSNIVNRLKVSLTWVDNITSTWKLIHVGPHALKMGVCLLRRPLNYKLSHRTPCLMLSVFLLISKSYWTQPLLISCLPWNPEGIFWTFFIQKTNTEKFKFVLRTRRTSIQFSNRGQIMWKTYSLILCCVKFMK